MGKESGDHRWIAFEDGESPCQRNTETCPQSPERPRGLSDEHDDMGGADLKEKAFQNLGGGAARQLPDASYLPGVEGDVDRSSAVGIEDEHARVAAR